MLALFELETEWVPVYNELSSLAQNPDGTFNMTRQQFEKWHREHDRCRDCGLLLTKVGWSRCCGGSEDGGIFYVCDQCRHVDSCRPFGDGSHVSHWGEVHPVSECDQMVRGREERRAKYRKEQHGNP